MSDLETLNILALVAIHYPILAQMGYISKLPFALVLPDANYIGGLMEKLGSVSIITDSMLDAEVEHTVKTASISPVIYFGSNRDCLSGRSAARMKQLIDMVRFGKIRGAEIQTLILFVFVRRIPASVASDFFTIHLNSDGVVGGSEQMIDTALIEGTVLNKRALEEVLFLYKNDDAPLKMMNAAIAISGQCFPVIELDSLYTTARKICELADDNLETGDICTLFQENIYRYASESDDYKIRKLPDIADPNETDIKRIIFYDENCIYISETLFKEITGDLRTIFSVDVIKNELVNQGILIGGKDRYSTKMTYITHAPEREVRRARMLRFSREKINKYGELGFIDLCQEKERRKNSENNQVGQV